ncbi:hypothetical protein MANES_13G000060v8 [Manihot esculenta]|uniref:Uncharacterized protein n=1 Tax=Manihot esculenta TaxID=3983 RepID=A0ACB7GJN4_MANES|nr:hypothetical protein MANES_13G000060v8 [Manihot esculenta]
MDALRMNHSRAFKLTQMGHSTFTIFTPIPALACGAHFTFAWTNACTWTTQPTHAMDQAQALHSHAHMGRDTTLHVAHQALNAHGPFSPFSATWAAFTKAFHEDQAHAMGPHPNSPLMHTIYRGPNSSPSAHAPWPTIPLHQFTQDQRPGQHRAHGPAEAPAHGPHSHFVNLHTGPRAWMATRAPLHSI